MENNVVVFNNAEFGEIRTVVIEGEPYFVAKDITDRLGFLNGRKAIADHVDEDDKGVTKCYTHGGIQEMTVINESGLFSLILSSKLPEAKKFRRWVTSEVLPTIRKTGGYHLPQTYQEALRELADKQDEIDKLEKINKELEPKGIFYDTVTKSSDTISMSEVAKILDMGVGRNQLFKILRNRGILMANNQPYQKYINQGYFSLVEESYERIDGTGIYAKTVVKQKGLDFIRKILLEELT